MMPGTALPSIWGQRMYAPCPLRTSTFTVTMAFISIAVLSGADMVIVALGCPKQELWMHRYAAEIAPAVAIEMARKTIDATERPSFYDVEAVLGK